MRQLAVAYKVIFERQSRKCLCFVPVIGIYLMFFKIGTDESRISSMVKEAAGKLNRSLCFEWARLQSCR